MEGQPESPRRAVGRDAFLAACRRKASRTTAAVTAAALALTAGLAAVASHDAVGSAHRSKITRVAPPAGPIAPDDRQVFPDPNGTGLAPPSPVVSRSS